MDTAEQPEQWLVRTAANLILGPFSRADVCRMVQEGRLGAQDEVCRANHYWIYLHEEAELFEQLGVRIARAARGPDDEITETETRSQPSNLIAPSAFAPQPGEEAPESTAMLRRPTGTVSRAEAPPVAEPLQVLSVPRSSAASPAAAPPAQAPQLRDHGGADLGRPSFWQGFAWVLVTALLLIFYFVLKALRSGYLH